MIVPVQFYSYFKDLTRCSETQVDLPEGAAIQHLLDSLIAKFPNLEGMKNSMLIAVGLEYQPRDYILQSGDRVSLFPPVQGG